MPFNSMLVTCLTTKKRFSECGKRVSFASSRGSDEIALFFRIDDNSNAKCSLRGDLGITGRICDGVVYYYAEGESTVCFVELKGKDLRDAVKQVENTFMKVRQRLKVDLASKIQWKACVLYGGAAHTRVSSDCMKKLESLFGRRGQAFIAKSGQHFDIGDLLRN